MSRYVKTIEVKHSKILINKVFNFLENKGFILGKRHGETVWTKSGFGCQHCIITNFKLDAVVVTAFITFFDAMSRCESEATIKGFLGGFGKWPLKKIVRALEKMLWENKDFENSDEIGIDGIPKVFADKYKDKENTIYSDGEIQELVGQFNVDFGLEKYALPHGFLEFTKTDKWYRISDDLLRINPVKYGDILEYAYNLLYDTDVFNIPPNSIPFAVDESGHETYVLDYRQSGINGEPRIVAVDNEKDVMCTDNEDVLTYSFGNNVIAKNFDEFLKICGFETTIDGEIEQMLLKLKNANLEHVEISPAHENFSAEKCKKDYPFLPDDYIAFLSKCNGIYSHTFCISGFTENFGMEPSIEMMQQYLDGYGKGYKAEDWFFFATDGMGGEYAFPTDAYHETVYYFDHEFPESVKECGSFIGFLEEEIDMLIDIA